MESSGKRGCVIIQHGSQSLRIGVASQREPTVVPNYVGRKWKRKPDASSPLLPSPQYDSARFSEAKNGAKKMLLQAGIIPNDEMIEEAEAMLKKPQSDNDVEDTIWVTADNSTEAPMDIDENECQANGSRLSSKELPSVLLGWDAIAAHKSGDYLVRKPVQNGYLASVGNGCKYQSIEELKNDVLELWRYGLEKINVNKQNISQYDVMVVIPDIFKKADIRIMIDVIQNLCFQRFTLVQEGVCASIAAGSPTSCVINIGAESTSITCVDEGITVPGASIWLPYGSDNAGVALFQLLKSSGFYCPFKMVQTMKQRYCTLASSPNPPIRQIIAEQGVVGGDEGPKGSVRRYRMNCSIEPVCAPMCLFKTGLLCFHANEHSKHYLLPPTDELSSNGLAYCDAEDWLSGLHKSKKPEKSESSLASHVTTAWKLSSGDDDDHDDDEMMKKEPERAKENIIPEKSAADTTVKENAAGSYDVFPAVKVESAITQTPGDVSVARKEEYEEELFTLDEGFWKVIERASAYKSELRNRLLANVVVAGGGASLPGLPEYLRDRLQDRATGKDSVRVVCRPRKIEPLTLCWEGALIMQGVDSVDDIMLTSKDWTARGIQALREAVPFVW